MERQEHDSKSSLFDWRRGGFIFLLCAALRGGHTSFSHTYFASAVWNLQSVNTSVILAVDGESVVMAQKETTQLFPIKNDLVYSVR